VLVRPIAGCIYRKREGERPARFFPSSIDRGTGANLLMDEFLLFNQALEAQEILDLYQPG